MSAKIRVLKIERPSLKASYYVEDVLTAQGELHLLFTEDEPGERLEITLLEMTREELEALPEFVGW